MKKRVFKILGIVAISLTAFLLTIALIFNIVYIKTKVSGNSMYPTLFEADRIYINQYELGKRGDIVVCNIKNEANWTENKRGDYVIKRLIAKEGDRVRIEKTDNLTYSLIVNDSIIETKVLSTEFNSYNNFVNFIKENKDNQELIENGNIVIGIGQIFIMGDNWEDSYDCSACGPISVYSLVGRVDIVVPESQNIVWGTINGIFKMWF